MSVWRMAGEHLAPMTIFTQAGITAKRTFLLTYAPSSGSLSLLFHFQDDLMLIKANTQVLRHYPLCGDKWQSCWRQGIYEWRSRCFRETWRREVQERRENTDAFRERSCVFPQGNLASYLSDVCSFTAIYLSPHWGSLCNAKSHIIFPQKHPNGLLWDM